MWNKDKGWRRFFEDMLLITGVGELTKTKEEIKTLSEELSVIREKLEERKEEVYFERGIECLDRGLLKEAVDQFRQCIKENPLLEKGWRALLIALYQYGMSIKDEEEERKIYSEMKEVTERLHKFLPEKRGESLLFLIDFGFKKFGDLEIIENNLDEIKNYAKEKKEFIFYVFLYYINLNPSDAWKFIESQIEENFWKVVGVWYALSPLADKFEGLKEKLEYYGSFIEEKKNGIVTQIKKKFEILKEEYIQDEKRLLREASRFCPSLLHITLPSSLDRVIVSRDVTYKINRISHEGLLGQYKRKWKKRVKEISRNIKWEEDYKVCAGVIFSPESSNRSPFRYFVAPTPLTLPEVLKEILLPQEILNEEIAHYSIYWFLFVKEAYREFTEKIIKKDVERWLSDKETTSRMVKEKIGKLIAEKLDQWVPFSSHMEMESLYLKWEYWNIALFKFYEKSGKNLLEIWGEVEENF